ncbi:MAG: protein TolQ [Nitrospinae bacterium RIFCSPLOWO2_12_FULL_45_22]|nr:MAG: protein TolQ [Nitrospinae bacterium RIFCSPLOWO2_12_FULL_45_22]
MLENPLGGAVASSFGGNILEMIIHAGPMAKFVLLILLFFSIFSWAIIGHKWKVLRRAAKETKRFQSLYYEATNLSSLYSAGKRLPYSSMAQVFVAGYTEWYRRRMQAKGDNPGSIEDKEHWEERLKGILNKAVSEEITKLEWALPFLATTGSTTPFIGLFGTVWGVMDAFRGIGVRGSAHIGAVAPGISEALIATAAGLAAAIPAVIAYNYFNHRIRVVGTQLSNFSAEAFSRLSKVR